MLNTNEVRELARRLHAGQVDKEGREYFAFHLEPIAAELAPFGSVMEQSGYLHDVVEDVDFVDADYLLDAGVDPRVVHNVIMVSRKIEANGKPEPYKSLIVRAASEHEPALLKLVDNGRNIESNPGLAVLDAALANSLLNKRYLPARRQLLDAEHERALAEYALVR